MKKVITIIMIAICTSFAFTSCSGKSANVSDKVYNYGIAILETCDEFLDGSISNKEAVNRMDNTIDSIKRYNDKVLNELGVKTMVEAQFDKNYQFYIDSDIELKASLLKYDIDLNNYDGTPTKEQIREKRNEFEKLLK
ncbi:MAG: hypothetical protein VZR54_03825 [Ruminococcus sp.]|nr:hypothetical protein [Ruminococcus sp.]